VGADWPISYPELRPYYEQIEQELPVAGDHWPWGDPHGYPHRPHPVGGNGEIFLRGAYKLGITAKVGPVAITNGRFGNRPHCIYRGFCLQGCKVNAKASPLITHIPDALAHGAEVRADAMVTRIAIDRESGRALGVHYVKDGKERFQRASMVAVAGYSIETPRLLLNSACERFPDGVGNDFDQVGRYLMVQGRAAGRGPVRRRGADVQGTATGGQHRRILRDRPGQGLQARVLHPDGLAAAHHLGRARRRAGALGRRAARVHERLRALVRPGRAV
jgi:choline dehydrogenase-like flavoprotein